MTRPSIGWLWVQRGTAGLSERASGIAILARLLTVLSRASLAHGCALCSVGVVPCLIPGCNVHYGTGHAGRSIQHAVVRHISLEALVHAEHFTHKWHLTTQNNDLFLQAPAR